MIDVTSEILLDGPAARKHPALRHRSGKPAHASTFHRLRQKGVLAADGVRVRLECVKCPGGWRTSEEAIQRFVERLTQGGGSPSPAMTTAAQSRQATRVDAELDACGIG